MTTWVAVSPCLRLFRLETAMPSGVRGPPLALRALLPLRGTQAKPDSSMIFEKSRSEFMEILLYKWKGRSDERPGGEAFSSIFILRRGNQVLRLVDRVKWCGLLGVGLFRSCVNEEHRGG